MGSGVFGLVQPVCNLCFTRCRVGVSNFISALARVEEHCDYLTYVLSLEGVQRCPSTGVSDSSDRPTRPQGKLAIHLQIPQLKFPINFISSGGAPHPFIRLTLHVWPTYHLRLWAFRRVRMIPASMTQT